MGEVIDIFDDNYNYIGVEDKSIAHNQGLWHRVFTCQIFNHEKSCVYFQRKVPGRYSFERPDYLDITVGGHYKAGETLEQGIRELYEETGISEDEISFMDLIPVGIRQTASTISPQYIANEFQHIYLLDYCGDESNLLKKNEETAGIVKVDLQDMIYLLLKKKPCITGHFMYYSGNSICTDNCLIDLSMLVPSYIKIDQLFLRLMIAIKRCIEKDDIELLFW